MLKDRSNSRQFQLEKMIMKGMDKPKAHHKKKKDSEVVARHAEKKMKRQERKHAFKILKRKSKRGGGAILENEENKP
jgi:hypothetical protein